MFATDTPNVFDFGPFETNTDFSIYFDDKEGGLDVNHVGVSSTNVKEWLPKLIEEMNNQKKEKATYEKRLKAHKEANPWLYPDENKESNKSN